MDRNDSRDERRDWRSRPPERTPAEQAAPAEQGERRRQPRTDRETSGTSGADSGPDYSTWYDKPSDWI